MLGFVLEYELSDLKLIGREERNLHFRLLAFSVSCTIHICSMVGSISLNFGMLVDSWHCIVPALHV